MKNFNLRNDFMRCKFIKISWFGGIKIGSYYATVYNQLFNCLSK